MFSFKDYERRKKTWHAKGREEEEEEEEDGIYIVEKIIDRRIDRDVVAYYLVKWEDYDESYNTWEPEENILDTSLITDWERGHPDETAMRDMLGASRRRQTSARQGKKPGGVHSDERPESGAGDSRFAPKDRKVTRKNGDGERRNGKSVGEGFAGSLEGRKRKTPTCIQESSGGESEATEGSSRVGLGDQLPRSSDPASQAEAAQDKIEDFFEISDFKENDRDVGARREGVGETRSGLSETGNAKGHHLYCDVCSKKRWKNKAYCSSCSIVNHQECMAASPRNSFSEHGQCRYCAKKKSVCIFCSNKRSGRADGDFVSDGATTLHKDAEFLYRCYRCRDAFHPECVPPGAKAGLGPGHVCCPLCFTWPHSVGSILGCKIVEEEGAGTGGALFSTTYLVKFDSKSHRCNAWVPESWLEKVGHAKLRAFKKAHPHSISSEQEERSVLGPYRDVEIEKVLHCEGGENGRVLVKWKNFDYESCTWEHEAELLAFDKSHGLNAYREAKRHYEQTMESLAQLVSHKSRKAPPTFRALKDQPPFLAHRLHAHQLEGLNWLIHNWHKRINSILADEMGLGKTIQTIVLVKYLWLHFRVRPVLVVAPTSVCRQWQAEVDKWSGGLSSIVYVGSKESREIMRKYELSHPLLQHKRGAVKSDIVITSYSILLRDEPYLRKIAWGVVVIDEAHRLKGSDSLLPQVLKQFSSGFRLLLTGTPLQNSLRELFNIMAFLDPVKFSDVGALEAKYGHLNGAGPAGEGSAERGEQEASVHQIHALLRPYVLRRTKMDIKPIHRDRAQEDGGCSSTNAELPPKIELIVPAGLTKLQKMLYKSILEKNCHALLENVLQSPRRLSLSNTLMDLRSCVNHPYLVEPGLETPVEEDTEEGTRESTLQRLVGASGKLALLDRILERLKLEGHRVLIFSQFTRLLDILDDYLTLKRWPFCRLDGQTAPQARQGQIDAYNDADSAYFVFLLSTRAGGQGINLATADTIVLYDCDYNPHNDLQALNRAHRYGQSKSVLVLKLVTMGTVEEKIVKVARKKLALDHVVVGKLKEPAVRDTDELASIVEFGAKEIFAELASEPAGSAIDERATDVTYDDQAIARLLSRTGAHQDPAGVPEDTQRPSTGLFEGFHIARVWADHDETETASSPSLASEPTRDVDFWTAVYQRVHKQPVEAEELGKGKRKRKLVLHDNSLLRGHSEDPAKGKPHADHRSTRASESGFPSPAEHGKDNTLTSSHQGSFKGQAKKARLEADERATSRTELSPGSVLASMPSSLLDSETSHRVSNGAALSTVAAPQVGNGHPHPRPVQIEAKKPAHKAILSGPALAQSATASLAGLGSVFHRPSHWFRVEFKDVHQWPPSCSLHAAITAERMKQFIAGRPRLFSCMQSLLFGYMEEYRHDQSGRLLGQLLDGQSLWSLLWLDMGQAKNGQLDGRLYLVLDMEARAWTSAFISLADLEHFFTLVPVKSFPGRQPDVSPPGPPCELPLDRPVAGPSASQSGYTCTPSNPLPVSCNAGPRPSGALFGVGSRVSPSTMSLSVPPGRTLGQVGGVAGPQAHLAKDTAKDTKIAPHARPTASAELAETGLSASASSSSLSVRSDSTTDSKEALQTDPTGDGRLARKTATSVSGAASPSQLSCCWPNCASKWSSNKELLGHLTREHFSARTGASVSTSTFVNMSKGLKDAEAVAVTNVVACRYLALYQAWTLELLMENDRLKKSLELTKLAQRHLWSRMHDKGHAAATDPLDEHWPICTAEMGADKAEGLCQRERGA